MEEAQELSSSRSQGMRTEEKNLPKNGEISKKSFPIWLRQYKWWLQMVIYSFFLLAGQTLGTLLSRVYFNNGGKSIWMLTLVAIAGYPILFPIQLFMKIKQTNTEPSKNRQFHTILASVYIALGGLLAGNSILYTIGLQYLPITTYTLICASQLGFTALFSYFLNKQKITPFIVNSVVLLTISSTLLVFQTDPGDSNKASKTKYVFGFICTLVASACYAVQLCITQLAFQKIVKKETFRTIIDMSVYQSIAASLFVLIGLFASGEWRKLNKEMDEFKTGRVLYVVNLLGIAVSWQAFMVGCVGLIFKISSLFSNVIGILGLPLPPVMAVIFLHDKLTGLKAMSMVLAIWGFVSYTYQHYLDDLKVKESKSTDEVSVTEGAGLATMF